MRLEPWRVNTGSSSADRGDGKRHVSKVTPADAKSWLGSWLGIWLALGLLVCAHTMPRKAPRPKGGVLYSTLERAVFRELATHRAFQDWLLEKLRGQQEPQ